MSNSQTKKKERSVIAESFIEVLQKNGRLLTIATIAVVLVGGISIIENRDSWWILVAGIIIIAGSVLLFINARVFIKVVIVSLLNLFMGTTAFQIGSFVDNLGTGGLVWMASTFFTFFALLAYSYATISSKSRWNVLGISTVLGFIATYILSIGGLNTTLSSIIGFVVAAVFFVIRYKTGKKNTFKKENMPQNILDEKTEKTILELFHQAEWGATSLKDNNKKDDETGKVLVWDEQGYILYPIFMEEAFTSVETKKTSTLSYQDNNINPWLLHLVFSEIPVWKARNANLNLVLLDMNNRNGKKSRVIGVNIPDSSKKIPVGIIPAKSLLSENIKEADNIITMLDSEMSIHTRSLSKKQKEAVSRIGIIPEKDNKPKKKKNEKKRLSHSKK